MRALLLILIGGGLIWLLIQGLGPSLAKDSGAEHSDGVLLHEESTASAVPQAPETGTPATGQPANPSDAQSPALEAPRPAAAQAEPTPPEPQPVKASAPRATEPAGAGLAEVEFAAHLVHQTDNFVEWLGTPREGLSPARRSLAKALALQLTGRSEDAAALAHELESTRELGEDERKLLDVWPQGPTFAMPSAGAASGSLLLRAAGLASAERAGREALAASRWAEAAASYSRLLREELRSPWETDTQCMGRWAECLNRAQQGYRWNKKGAWPALELKVAPGDSLIGIRKRALQESADLLTCTGLIARANQLQGETIQPGQTLRVPTGKPQVLVDLSARWMLLMLDDEVVGAWPVGVGKPGSETPSGRFKVGEKNENPTWFRAGQPPVPAGDPRNPLGTRWVAWLTADGEKTHLGFHGTRDPDSIGQDESEGCVRMLNRHVEELYEILPRGSEILLQH